MNRSELYEAVWSKPLFHVARQLGVGDRALAAACKKAAIPTPPRGYWRKVAAGQATVRPPLSEVPPASDDVALQRHTPSTPAEAASKATQWPTDHLKNENLDQCASEAYVATQFGIASTTTEAVIDALAAKFYEVEARRAFLARVAAVLATRAHHDAGAIRRVALLLQATSSRSLVEAASNLLATGLSPDAASCGLRDYGAAGVSNSVEGRAADPRPLAE